MTSENITRTEETFRILSDEEVLHWLSHNVGMLKDPKHQGVQDQKLLKMQVSICTELMSRRNGPRPEAQASICYYPCDKHMGVPWTIKVGVAASPRQVCPICNPPTEKT